MSERKTTPRAERKEILSKQYNLTEHNVDYFRLFLAEMDAICDGNVSAERAVNRLSRIARGLPVTVPHWCDLIQV